MKCIKVVAGYLIGIILTSTCTAWEWQSPSGHLKYQFDGARYPDNSIYQTLVGDTSRNHLLDNRWKFPGNQNDWDVNVDYQLQVLHGDSRQVSGVAGLSSSAVPDDNTRLFDLTHTLSDKGDTVVLHRLDRFNIGHTTEHTVLRFGRQVVSWGNGLFFNPMDFFNPFDPTALDKEYKTGDDLLYGQYLFDSGADLQGVWVFRRDPADNNVNRDVSSTAFKYHTWLSDTELDLLLAQHFDDDIAGIGAIKSIGGAVWRGDLMFTHTDNDTYTSLVTNLSYSWVWGDANWSGALEYFYNGMGFSKKDYTVAELATKPDLLQRLLRGELYTTAKHYVAGSVTVELTPLLLATPAMFVNVDDRSAYLQLGGQYNVAQNWQLTAALNIPIGSEGTEYGGLATGVGGTTLAVDWGVFFQLGFYY